MRRDLQARAAEADMVNRLLIGAASVEAAGAAWRWLRLMLRAEPRRRATRHI